MSELLRPGLRGQKQEVVTEAKTAIAYGSGSVAVYATPAMVGLMEGACLALVDPLLEADQGSVGTALNIRHTAATPVGMTVRAEATLTAVEDRRLLFELHAFDEKEEIGSGTHERFIINVPKFLGRAEGKKA